MWKAKDFDKSLEQTFISQGKHRLIARLLSQRKIPDSVDGFLSSDYKSLSDPFLLPNLSKGVDLFKEAIKEKLNISVIGDYDVDGILSSVMIKQLCENLKLYCHVFLPSRFEEGYGLSDKTLEGYFKEIKDKNIGLLIVVDCGSNNEKEIIEIKKIVKNVLIIDHHMVNEDKMSKSANAFINWHLSDKCGEMCASGLVYQFIRGLYKSNVKINPIEYLSYAAIGTVSDLVQLNFDNRIIVRNGLQNHALNVIHKYGLNSLIRKAKIFGDYLTQEEVLFRIAPRINSAGRMGDPYVSYLLMMQNNLDDADRLAEKLEEYNSSRKVRQKKSEKEAIERIKSNLDKYTHGIFVYDPSWDIGVNGIIASKLVETFNKPSIVAGIHDGLVKGSCRSVQGVNIKEILDECSQMFISYGGHKMAAGVTLKKEFVENANSVFNECCKKILSKNIEISNIQHYDAKLKLSSVSEDVANLLIENMYPYSEEINPEPIFLLEDVVIYNAIFNEKYSLLTIFVERNGEKCSYPMTMFSPRFGQEIIGSKVNLYVKLPQKINNFGKFQVNVFNVEFLEDFG